MNPLQNRPDMVPGVARFVLDDPDEQKGQETEKDMGPDPLFLPVVDGPELQGGLERSEGPLHLDQLLVPQRDVLGTETVIAAGQQIGAVKTLLGGNFRLVEPDAASLELPEIPAHGPVRQKRTHPPAVLLTLSITKNSQMLLYLLQRPVPRQSVLLCLLRIVHDDEPPAPLAVTAHDDFLDLKGVTNFPVPAGTGQGLGMHPVGITQLLPDDVMPPGLLKDYPVVLAVHPPVHHPHTPVQPPARQISLDPLHRRHVLRVARQYPAPDRNPLLRHRNADHHLRQVGPLVLGVTVPPDPLTLCILLVTLHIAARRVEEHEVNLKVQQVGGAEEDFLLYLLFMRQQKVHRTVQMLKLDRLGIVQGD